MLLGKVIGNLWATKKHPLLNTIRLLIVSPICAYNLEHNIGYLIVADSLGAGIGEMVLVAFGEPARQVTGASDLPLEAAVIGIVDKVEGIRIDID